MAAFTVACTLSAIACDERVAVPTPTVRSISITGRDPLQVAVGTTATLRTFAEFVTPMYEPIFAALSSSRTDVATVASKAQTIDWTLTAIAAGQTTIHATHGCGAADLPVTVTR